MDNRETWKTLLAKLALARERLEARDYAAALEAVDAALGIDPEFLAAHSLRQRIELDRLTTAPQDPGEQAPGPSQEAASTSIDTIPAPPDTAPPLPDTAAPPTANHRRFGAILAEVYEHRRDDFVRREESSSSARLTQAESPLPEETEQPIRYATEPLTPYASEPPKPYEPARPISFELKRPVVYEEPPVAYENELLIPEDVFRTTRNVGDTGFIELRLKNDEDADDFLHASDRDSPTSRSTGIIQVIVGAAVLIAVILMERPDRYESAIRDLLRWPEQAEPAPAPLLSSPIPVRLTELVAGGRSPNLERSAGVTPSGRETVAAPTMRTVSNEAAAPVSQTAASPAAPLPADAAAPAVDPNRSDPRGRAPVTPGSDAGRSAQPEPSPTPVSPAAAPAAVPATMTDEQGVKQALQRYRSAYDRLDARLARNVWPSVNEAALARAFDSLQSQSLTFTACDVSFKGPAAMATCEGTMRYRPRIGTRDSRIEPHVWTFTLRKRGADWEIDSVRAAR